MAEPVCQGCLAVICVMRTMVDKPRPQPAALTCASEAGGSVALLWESLLTLIIQAFLDEAGPEHGSDR